MRVLEEVILRISLNVCPDTPLTRRMLLLNDLQIHEGNYSRKSFLRGKVGKTNYGAQECPRRIIKLHGLFSRPCKLEQKIFDYILLKALKRVRKRQ